MAEGASATWYVLAVPPNCEKRIGGELRRLGLRYLIPCTKQRIRVTAGKKQHIRDLPLFPRYVFIGVTGDVPWKAIKDIQPAPVVPIQFDDSGPAKLSARDVEYIHNPVVLPLNADPEALREGVVARIMSGPLEGLKSKIARVRGSYAELEGIGPLGTMRVPVKQLEAA